ncbi:fasciclin domain-containing protein [Salinimicrobium soli]|uniref:fasciclin domain-containing protein n=1 Tax=Salinimicrobium soli TaxID=1254399 RepID=UPI003AAB7F21
MKTKVTQLMNPRITLNLFFMALLSLFLVSCEKDEMKTVDSLDAKAATEMKENNASPAPGDVSIAGVVVNSVEVNGEFEYLLESLVYVDEMLDAGLVPMFSSTDDQYTVFAPTDEAFKDLLAELTDIDRDDLMPEDVRELAPDLLLAVLSYHVTDGRRGANSVVPKKNNKTIQTLLGEKFQVTSEGQILANASEAWITSADISASNGIIHVISAVLLP